jgi:putative transposase
MIRSVSRPLRIDHPGAIWHITARGNNKKNIFRDDLDRERWLWLLAEAVEMFDWRLHAYILMDNHFHLVVETPVGNLSRGMRHLNGVHSIWFNRRHGRTGHLFEGRFRAKLVERETYLLEVLRYVVLNRVRARVATTPGEWPWSSYRATAGEEPAPPWLEVDWSRAQFGGSAERFAGFVAEGTGIPRLKMSGRVYLGSARFIDEAVARAKQHARSPEIPKVYREAPRDVLATVMDALGLSEGELRRPRARVADRSRLAYALRRWGGLTGELVGERIGVSGWHASACARAGQQLWRVDPRCRDLFA